ncbi:MAG TPA: PIN domain-containing protein [Ktedonobacterales bacterium]|nr:PIN domain-containing protein [Ktedonobacterales bacterium]
MSGRFITRLVAFALAVVSGIGIFVSMTNDKRHHYPMELSIGVAAGSAVIILALILYISVVPYRWVREQIRKAEVSDVVAAVIGLIVGLCIAALANIFLSQVKFLALGQWLPILAAVAFAYIGIATAVVRKDDFSRLFASAWSAGRVRRLNRDERDRRDERDADERDERDDHSRFRDRLAARKNTRQSDRILVDTSAIIDGRLADISETGFVTGTLVAPRFVLEELQHIADSADSMRRNRGRRGLEILQRLQKNPAVAVEISDADAENVPEVDAKLVKLARQWHCPIITNDFNLNRVAELQGVKVLNINELAHAVKPILLPGEEMSIKIMQDGKEIGQGVGYLDDGTMIVVEGGKLYIGNTVDVTVTRVLQTVAGRMIFAHPKQHAGNGAPARRIGAS